MFGIVAAICMTIHHPSAHKTDQGHSQRRSQAIGWPIAESAVGLWGSPRRIDRGDAQRDPGGTTCYQKDNCYTSVRMIFVS